MLARDPLKSNITCQSKHQSPNKRRVTTKQFFFQLQITSPLYNSLNEPWGTEKYILPFHIESCKTKMLIENQMLSAFFVKLRLISYQ